MILQFPFLFYYVCAKSFEFSSTSISLSYDICSVFKINIILPLRITFIILFEFRNDFNVAELESLTIEVRLPFTKPIRSIDQRVQ